MIVGYEGLIGAALMLGVMLPIVSALPGKDGDGIHEDSADTWHVSLEEYFFSLSFVRSFVLLFRSRSVSDFGLNPPPHL